MSIGILVTSILVLICSLILIGIIIVQYRPKNTILFTSIFYVIIIIATYFLVVMFRDTVAIIRYDIISDVANTARYSGFIETNIVLATTTIGVVVGYIMNSIINYVKNKNFKEKWNKKR